MSFTDVIQLLCSPLNQFILLLIVSTFALRNKIKAKRAVQVGAMVWLLLCSQYSFSSWLMTPIENKVPVLSHQENIARDADQIFILAGYINADETRPSHTRLSSMTRVRIFAALANYRAKPRPILITGGFFTYDEQESYAEKVSEILAGYGVAPEHLITIPHGTNTAEEVTAILPYMQNQKTLVISSASHMPRLTRLLSDSRHDVVYFPVDFRTQKHFKWRLNTPSIYALETTRRALYEYLALLWYEIKYRSN